MYFRAQRLTEQINSIVWELSEFLIVGLSTEFNGTVGIVHEIYETRVWQVSEVFKFRN